MVLATTTIIRLEAEQLPKIRVEDATFVTIWLALIILCTVGFQRLLSRRDTTDAGSTGKRSTYPEFWSTFYGSFLLGLWYIVTVVDRWLHFDQRSVPYGYILIGPIFESLRVGSAMLLIWGAYKIVYKEFEDRLRNREKKWWWFGAKLSFFVVFILSLFYVTLYLSLAIVWLLFRSLNVIDDVATKRNNFEIALSVFLSVFCFLTFVAASATILGRARGTDGKVPKDRLILIFATLMLFLRSVAEVVVIAAAMASDSMTRKSLQFSSDVLYGLFTSLHLGLMYAMALLVTYAWDTNSKESRLVKSHVRWHILDYLRRETDGGRRQSPKFKEVLHHFEQNMDSIITTVPLPPTLEMPIEHKRRAAEDCLNELGAEYLPRDPREGNDYGRSATRSPFFTRLAGGIRLPSAASNSSIKSQTSHGDLLFGESGSQSRRSSRTGNRQASGSRNFSNLENFPEHG